MNAPNKSQITSKEQLLNALVEEISIPSGFDEKARSRYDAIGAHLDRPNSGIRHLSPQIMAQGSFALGTVIRPIGDNDAYDVDLVCRLDRGQTAAMTQAELKAMVGAEIRNYAQSTGMKQKPTEGRRCWTLEYADEASFHMDILPALPGGDHFARALSVQGFSTSEHSATAIAITDRTHKDFHLLGSEWPVSNPEGYLRWFRQRQALVIQRAIRHRGLRSGKAYATVEDFPNHTVRTPLQDAIKLLKRHRDAMFDGDEHKPISIIISTLAATFYEGQTTIEDTLRAILPRMHRHVSQLGAAPVIPNPSFPAENFADKWVETPAKRKNFEKWVAAVRQDFLEYLNGTRFNALPRALRQRMSETTIKRVTPRLGLAAAMLATGAEAVAAEVHQVEASGSATKPWFDVD